MLFANPAMLFGLLLVAIPIIIALLNRQRHREVHWAAMAFLEAALRKNRRRLTFQNLLLLLLRTAILLILVMALARPFLKESNVFTSPNETNRRVVLVIDRSFSMGHRPGTELSSLDRTREAVSELFRHYVQDGDQLRVFLFDESTDSPYQVPLTVDPSTKEQVLGELADLEPSHYATDVARSLRTVLAVLQEGEKIDLAAEQTEIFLITDMQRNGWVGDIGLRDPGLATRLRQFGEAHGILHLIDVGSEGSGNLVVQGFAAAEPIITPAEPIRLDAVVRSHSGQDQTKVEVSLVVDGTVRKNLTYDVPAGNQRTFSFSHVFSTAGSHSVTARIAADNLAIDNERHLALEVRERVPILIVDGDPQEELWKSETDFIRYALAPAGGDSPGDPSLMEVTVINESDLGGESLEGFAVIVLANVASLADDQISALERYVSAGGGLLVSLGDQIDADFYVSSLYRDGSGLLPAAIGDVVEGEAMTLKLEDLSHPAIRFFEPEDYQAILANDFFFRYFSVKETAKESKVLIRMVQGEAVTGPVLMEKSYGRGRVMLYTTTLDDDWNGFTTSWTYVAMMQLWAVYLSDTASSQKNLLVGDRFEKIIPPASYADDVRLITPSRDSIRKPLIPEAEGSDHFSLSHDPCDEAGIYEIIFSRGETEAPVKEYFAVNVRTEESDL
ncbi:MAG: BatA domain-containing protein, partial [Planctomycetota bacterium]|nr:BatA domain-containing protein [Planctomycetota bacterium]